MCRVCEHPCWRDGGEGECLDPVGGRERAISDEEFDEALNELDAKIIDLMERLQCSLAASKRRVLGERVSPNEGGSE